MNIQNLSKRPGIREAFIARPGTVLAQCDYPTLELYTLAQCCVSYFGESRLADALNAGQDPHLLVAARILDISYEDAVARAEDPEVDQTRQLSKAFNFGRPGGMGDLKFVTTTRRAVMAKARADKKDPKVAWAALALDVAKSKTLGVLWREALPEMSLWFARADSLKTTDDGRGSVESLFTKRYRGQATFCARCNTPFQGLAADAAKNAGWLVTKAMYVERTSPLYGSRIVAFVHDEFICEVPEDRAHDAAYELARLMRVGANVYLPNVPIPEAKMKPLLMRRWSKKAKPRFVDGRLAVWQ